MVVRYLTDEWLTAAATAYEAAGSPLPRATEIVVQQIVTDTPDGEVAYTIELSGQSVRLHTGRVDNPTVSFTQSWHTACAIARGEQSAQAAFMDGLVRIGGATQVLVDNHDLLADVDDLLGELRQETSFEDS